MILEDLLSPVPASILESADLPDHPQSIFAQLRIHRELEGIPDLEGVKIALIGVLEDRGSRQNTGCKDAPNEVRQYLYKLYSGKWDVPVADLGNFYPGETLTDTYEGLRVIYTELLKKQIIPLIIGGSQDLTYANYRAYQYMEQTVNLVSIDSRFDLGKQDDPLCSENYLSHIIVEKPYILFNFGNIGHQTYFVNQEEIDLMERLYFDIYRLGSFRQNMQESEPILRDADIISFDISALKQSDAPASRMVSPNGFSGEEACILCRYAGLSDKTSSFGIYECNPRFDHNGQTAHLVAQMIWYFIEGVNHRKGDYPFIPKTAYQKFTVLINEGEHELIFYKSHLSERWWVEVNIHDRVTRQEWSKLIPCSYSDYQKATQNDIPITWWRAMKKSV